MDAILKCEFCQELFGRTGDREPKMLPCQHTFCKRCVMKIVDPEGTVCPTCQVTHTDITSPQSNSIKNNLAIFRILNAKRAGQVEVEDDENRSLFSYGGEIVKIYIINVMLWAVRTVNHTAPFSLQFRYKSVGDFVWEMAKMPVAVFLKSEMHQDEIEYGYLFWGLAIVIVAVVNYTWPTVQKAALYLLRAPVWKAGLTALLISIPFVLQSPAFRSRVATLFPK
ncbi:uncharacterized protein LOC120334789 [Styela clava]